MALLSMIIRKMTQNKWLELSLLLGLIITVGLVSSIPTYTEAILSRMLVKELETNKSSQYPGAIYTKFVYAGASDGEQRQRKQANNDHFIVNAIIPKLPVPLLAQTSEIQTNLFEMKSERVSAAKPDKVIRARLSGITDVEQHIRLVDGRMPANAPVDGVYEVLVTERALNFFHAVLDTVFTIEGKDVQGTIQVKPVGVFTKITDDDLFFQSSDLGSFSNVLLMDRTLLEKDLLGPSKLLIGSNSWYLAPDYSKLELSNVERYLQTVDLIKQRVRVNYQDTLEAKSVDVIQHYFDRAGSLRILMWSLNVPVLVMLALYVFMVSNLITNRQKTEIAVLRSRGASRLQIVLSYIVEYSLLGALAVATGPPLGLFLTKVLGSSNGFMSFVQRSGIRVHLNNEVYVYASLAALVTLLIMLAPVIVATRVTIVGHKQQMARMHQTPLWHKFFLDVIALGLSLYGLWIFRRRMETLQSLGLGNDDLHIDPLQFAVPALFIIGAGMLLLRIYPYCLRLVYWIGRKWWPPSLYATLIQVGRSIASYQFLMIFLMMTIATGMFSASAARTINSNVEDRIQYGNGADIVLQTEWPNDAPPPSSSSGPQAASEQQLVVKQVHYTEPPFEPYTELEGVEHAAKVFVKKDARFSASETNGQATLMGIDTDDFGYTSWFRNGLLPYSFYDYLNVIALEPKSVLISRSLAENSNLTAGDTIWVGWDGVDQQPFVVFAIIDYFPTYNPNPQTAQAAAPMLIVGHRQQIQTYLSLEPYQVWLKLKPDASVSELYRDMENKKLAISSITDTTEDLRLGRTDPFLMAVNGALTLGFLISLAVSFTGFLLYWMLVLRGRTLQNGIMRAMGLSLRQLLGMLTVEQALTSGASIVIGLITGLATSRLFVPVFQNAFDAKTLVPPFRVIVDPADSIRIYVFVGMTILIGLCILGYMLSRLKIHQAIKLGED